MVGHFIVLLHVMYHNYNLVSLGFKLHNAHTIIIMSSTCFLYIRLHSVSENILNSLIRLIAFSTLMRTLAISLDCIAYCPVSLPSDKKLGMVKKHLFHAYKSHAVYPLSANIRCPGCKTSSNPLCSTVCLSTTIS